MPEKEDLYPQRYVADEMGAESDYRGSDIVNFVVEQQRLNSQNQPAADTTEEIISMQEDLSMPSSTSTARERQLAEALKPDMIASTAF